VEKKEEEMKAHICIGGPLDGMFATSKDFEQRVVANRAGGGYDIGYVFREGGMYGHLHNEYVQFNNASRPYHVGKHGRKRAQVAWIHIDILKPSISPKDR
jgi:hypothetical protein